MFDSPAAEVAPAWCPPDLPDEEFNGVLKSGQIGQAYFGSLGQEVHNAGWAVFPQQRTGRRLPSRIDGEVIKWGLYQTERVDQATLDKWLAQGRHANLAVIMGPSSGNALAIDIDVTDELVSLQVEAVAEETLGRTDFKRVGAAPKIMLFYRLAEEASFTKRILRLSEEDDATRASPHMVEILAKQSAVTFYGRHHITGAPFRWYSMPTHYGPHDLPLITEEMLAEFERALALLRPIVKTGSSVDRSYTLAVVSETKTGSRRVVVPAAEGKIENGKIVEGREEFLRDLVFALGRANAHPSSEEEIGELAKIAFDIFTEKADRSGRWTDSFLQGQIREKLTRVYARIAAGDVQPMTATRRAQRTAPTVASEVFEHVDDGLDWITPHAYRENPTTKRPLVEIQQEQVSRAAHRRRMRDAETRAKINDRASKRIDRLAEKYFWACVRGDHDGAIEVIKAATGSGKSSRFLRRLLALAAEHHDMMKGRSFKFVVPSHENAVDLLKKAHAEKAEIRAVRALDGMTDEMVRDLVMEPQPVSAGKIAVGIMLGRAAAGCAFENAMTALASVDATTSSICFRDEPEPTGGLALEAFLERKAAGKLEKVECWFKKMGQCRYYKQEALLSACSIVFAPRAYLTVNTPTWMIQNTAGLIIDEDPTLSIAKVYQAELADLATIRMGVARKSMRKLGVEDDDQVTALRDLCWKTVVTAMLDRAAGKDVPEAARVLSKFDHRYMVNGNECQITGDMLIEAAAACAARSDTLNRDLMPYSGADDPAAFNAGIKSRVAATPRGSGLTAERALIRVIKDRMKRLRADDAAKMAFDLKLSLARVGLVRGTPAEHAERRLALEAIEKAGWERTAHGSEDARLQLIQAEGAEAYTHVRISERLELNWAGVPTALLDASAQQMMVEKAFDRPARMHSIVTASHLRVAACIDAQFSDSAILIKKDDDPKAIKRKMDLREELRLAITKVCRQFAPTRILVVCTKMVEAWLFSEDWAWPANCDHWHFGHLRGLDGAKQHAALVTIGRSQMPVGGNDGLAAAYAHDDVGGFTPFDRAGTGVSADGKRIFRNDATRELRLRNGHTLNRHVSEMPEGWGRAVDTAWTTEEIRQAPGRLRFIYRQGEPPLWLHFGTEMPSDFIVDRLFKFSDMLADAQVAERARLRGEIMAGGEALNRDVAPFDERLAREELVRTARARFPKLSTGKAIQAWEDLQRRKETYPKAGFAEQEMKGLLVAIEEPDRHVALLTWADDRVEEREDIFRRLADGWYDNDNEEERPPDAMAAA